MVTEKYPLHHRILHWLIALGIIGMLCFGFYLEGLPRGDAAKPFLIGLHKATGATILGLVILRLFSRGFSTMPALPVGLKNWERGLAHLVHALLYLAMVAMPVSGIVFSNAYGYKVNVFGLFELPALVEKNIELGKMAAEAHEFIAWSLIVLLALHILGVIKHRFFDAKTNDVLPRML